MRTFLPVRSPGPSVSPSRLNPVTAGPPASALESEAMNTRPHVPELGVPEMDSEHALQVQFVRAVRTALLMKDRSGAIDLLSQLDDVTGAHFAAEQMLMRLRSYPAYPLHEGEHDRLLGDLRLLRQMITDSDPQASAATAAEIEQALINHISTSDRAFAQYLKTTA